MDGCRVKILLKKYLSSAELKEVSDKIAEAERTTSGEIRVSIRHRRAWRERKLSVSDLTLSEFRRLGMHATKERTAVLILLLISERKFHIMADEGIHKKVEDGTWDRIAASMSAHFKEGHFGRGLCDAVDAVAVELTKYFPRRADDRDELPNDVVER